MKPDNTHEPSRQVRGEITVSRRLFLASTTIGGAALGVGILSSAAVQEQLFEKLDKKSLAERLRSEAISNRRNGIRTAVETIVVWAGNIAVGEVVDRAGIEHGGHAGDFEEKSTLGLYVKNNFAIPVIEEAIFRLLPSSFFAEERAPNIRLHWKTGLTANLIFGSLHNISKPEPDKLRIHLNSLPLEQLILGAYCWYAQRTGGFFHSAGAHILYNNLCEAYYHLYEKHRFTDQTSASP